MLLLPSPESLMGPVRPPIVLSPSATLCLPCATFRSPHTAGVLNFL
ncbi:unnamed protein product, partial [Staurois parvus]